MLDQFYAAICILVLFLLVLWLAGAFISWHFHGLFDEAYLPPRDRLLIALRWPLDVYENR